MTSNASDWELGECRSKVRETVTCRYTGTIAAGDVVEINAGTDPDGTIKVQKQAGNGSPALGVALYAGVADDYNPILIRGIVKVTFGGTIGIAEPVAARNGEVYAKGASNASGVIGTNIGPARVDNDTGLILVHGGVV